MFNMNRGGFNNTPSPMHVNDFEIYGQQQQQQQTPQQQPQHQPQAHHYHGNNIFNSEWQKSFDPLTSTTTAPHNHNINMMNIGGQGTSPVMNMTTNATTDATQHWNVLASMHVQQQQQHHQLHQQQQQQQSQMQQHQQAQVNLQYSHQNNNNNNNNTNLTSVQPSVITTATTTTTPIQNGDPNIMGTTSTNDNGPTISNLLSLDSEQYMRINSDELQQISCLSIST